MLRVDMSLDGVGRENGWPPIPALRGKVGRSVVESGNLFMPLPADLYSQQATRIALSPTFPPLGYAKELLP